ncbi:hypothetical protein K504DRAFT_456834 [Pleomassaria siparia CBS 279.74]|uniref:Uncharacterized protein n=1 Tax=Pleomassaria siparia CBS 279.74 TaxID=1314801 RepID=A0A6G1KPA7_9PLEO|nr:hypothetical protein K504DRAFT_456834 [Pleomassaria siparia CBS 279.74]
MWLVRKFTIRYNIINVQMDARPSRGLGKKSSTSLGAHHKGQTKAIIIPTNTPHTTLLTTLLLFYLILSSPLTVQTLHRQLRPTKHKSQSNANSTLLAHTHSCIAPRHTAPFPTYRCPFHAQ